MPSKSRRPNREEVRASILQTARDIAASEGWSCVTVRKVAERIGYTAPIIYEHFGSKDVMLTEILKDSNKLLYDTILGAVKGQKDPSQALHVMAIAYWDFAHKSPELYRLMHGMEGALILDKGPRVYAVPLVGFVTEQLISVNPSRINPQNAEAHVVEVWSMLHGLISLNLSGYVAHCAEACEVLEMTIADIIYALKGRELALDA